MVWGSSESGERAKLRTEDSELWIEVGTLARGFLGDEAKLVVVTDAEIFGRYRVQRPRRLKSPHAAAMRSALEIDFADLPAGHREDGRAHPGARSKQSHYSNRRRYRPQFGHTGQRRAG